MPEARVRSSLATLVLAFAAAAIGKGASAGETTRVSVDSSGNQGNDESYSPSISADARLVVFVSNASNLIAGDTNQESDVFIQDRQSGKTTRVSVDSSGSQGNGFSELPFISADGRFVAFSSNSTNLVAGDTNGFLDAFVHDRQSGETTRVSVDSFGNQANDDSYVFSISADGRFVGFSGYASNLVLGDTNGTNDVFVHDRQNGETTRVSVNSSGNQGNGTSQSASISAGGRFVAFFSFATNLVVGDTNQEHDVFVHDRQSGETTRVSVDSFGNQANDDSYVSSISADGRFVVFVSDASNLVEADSNAVPDAFVHDRQSGETSRVSVDSFGNQGNDQSYSRSISADGRFVAFQSLASNLVLGDTNGTNDVFVHDRQSGETTRVSVDSSGNQGDAWGTSPVLSADGRLVAFYSFATNLVVGDTNGTWDVFVHNMVASEMACRAGNVNANVGPIADVLFINGSPGIGSGRYFFVMPTDPLMLSIALPPSKPTGMSKCCIYAWVGEGNDATVMAQPFGLGMTCRATPLNTGALGQPQRIANSIGFRSRLGTENWPGPPTSPAPTVLLSLGSGLGRTGRFLFQGFINDSAAPNGYAAITNAVLLVSQ